MIQRPNYLNKVNVAPKTISRYLEIFENAYLIEEAQGYDIKGKNYIGSPLKYYFTDIGIRNAMLNFRQNGETHIMENIIYNELVMRGYSVDVGVVEYASKDENGKVVKTNLEVDFIVNNGDERTGDFRFLKDSGLFQENRHCQRRHRALA